MATLGLHDAHMRKLLASFKAPETELEVVHIEDEEIVSATLPATPYYYRSLFKHIHAGEEQGFDAAIIGCCGDPGLKPARNMARIPVLGAFQASLHLATMLGKRVGVLCPAKDGRRQRPFSWHEDSLLTYGFQHHVAKFRAVNLERPDQNMVEKMVAENRLADLSTLIIAAHRRSIEGEALKQARLAIEDGADVILLACTLWGGMADPLARELGVPVVDPVYAVLKMAEATATAARAARAGQR